MRFSFLVLITATLFSCNQPDNKATDNVFFPSIDTLLIKSHGRIFELESYLFKSDLDNNKGLLYIFNNYDHSIDEIDLNKLEFVQNYHFEKNGPNGVGERVFSINYLGDDLFFFKAHNQSIVLDKMGRAKQRINWAHAMCTDSIKFGNVPQMELAVYPKNLSVFGLSFDHKERSVVLDVLNVSENRVHRFDVDAEKSYQNFVLTIEDPANYSYIDPSVFLSSANNMVAISHQFSNEISLFNNLGRFIQTVRYQPELTPARAKDFKSKNISSYNQLKEEYQNLLEQVRYGPPVWDESKERYIRLSTVKIFSDRYADEYDLLPELKEVNVYLSVFDSDFKLIKELQVPELESEFVKYFAKDGKLWVFKNFSDELGFIVIDF